MLAKGVLEIARDPGPGFYSRLFLVEKASGSWRPERVRPADSIQDGNSRFCTVICQRGGFSSFPGSEGRVFSDPNPSIFEKAIEVHVGGDSLPVPCPVFRSVDCSPGLHQGLRSRVSVGTLPRDQTSPVSGRLVGSLLFGAGSQAGRPVAPLALPHPRDCDKREEVGSRALADCEVSRHGHRYRGRQGFSSLARVEKFLMVAESFYTMAAPPAQLWQVILGHLASLERLVPHGCLRMRSLQWHLKAPWSPESDPPSLPVPLPREVRRDLSRWMVRGDHLLTGVRFGTPAPDLHLYSDASCSGWGAHLLDQHVSGVWFDQEKLLHINLLEMKALFLGLQAFREDVRQLDGRGVRQQARGHSFPGSVLVDQPPSEMDGEFRHPSRCEVSSRTSQCPGRSPQPSRASVGTEWSHHPQMARSLLRVWGNLSIDLFATSLNARLPLYCSLVPDPQAVFKDAFRHPWDDLDLYAFPPFPLVGRVIARVRESSRVSMTLVAPLWPEKEWFADLLLLLTQPPLAPPWWDSLLRQPHCNLFHQGVHSLNLHAWRLSSVTSESWAFREGLLESCQRILDPPPRASTSRGGRSSVVGVVEGALLQLTPLFQ